MVLRLHTCPLTGSAAARSAAQHGCRDVGVFFFFLWGEGGGGGRCSKDVWPKGSGRGAPRGDAAETAHVPVSLSCCSLLCGGTMVSGLSTAAKGAEGLQGWVAQGQWVGSP